MCDGSHVITRAARVTLLVPGDSLLKANLYLYTHLFDCVDESSHRAWLGYHVPTKIPMSRVICQMRVIHPKRMMKRRRIAGHLAPVPWWQQMQRM
jgi:hypothetical protein